MTQTSQLAQMAQKLRRLSLLATSEADSGHPTTCMSCAEIMSVLFFHEMKYDPKEPGARNTDAFVMSKGHAAPILWAALHEAGCIAEDPLTLRQAKSPLEGHPTPLSPWIRVATGSLGQGLSAAVGIALSRKFDGIASRVYCLMGDGETAEGSVWEAAAFAAHNQMDRVCAIVDVNGLGQSGPTMHLLDAEAYGRKFAAFGWAVLIVDGHSVPALIDAFEKARTTEGRPTAIIARTVKGKGVSALEGKEGWHGKPLKKGPELEAALRELGDTDVTIPIKPRTTHITSLRTTVLAHGEVVPEYAPGQEVATREAYGTALAKLGRINPDVVVLDGDVKNSTFSEKFKAVRPERFVEAFIAEQNMVGMATGLAADGKIPFASTFAAFLTRAHDQIRMAVYSRVGTLVLCGSHAGVSIGEDGPSQMGLEDLAMFRALLDSTVLYPADAVSAERLVAEASMTRGVIYIRTTRPKTPVLYANSERFPVGGSKTLRTGANDRATVVAAGITIFEALHAADQLGKEGIPIRVIDAYCVKPIDAKALRRAAEETKHIITVEDHSIHGGLGDAVAHEVSGLARVEMLGVSRLPRSATPKEEMEMHGITAATIIATVRKVLGR
ncbi:MAG TPA: transketolase [Planctomycetota bacterium]